MPHKRKDLKIKGPDLWYFVGLITSDGSLSKDGRHINITAKDKEFLGRLKERLGLDNKIGIKNRNANNQAYKIEFANRLFYDFLLNIGLLPKKSLTLRSLKIPKVFFVDFLRGVIDGDGCVRRWKHASNFHEQWALKICSGAGVFIKWLEASIEEYLGCKGKIYSELKKGFNNPYYILKYGKIACKEILGSCYYHGAFAMNRKMKSAISCVTVASGWSKSKTVRGKA
ncbi:MAG: LAGLIDADG family homing endonuclease [Candidatus Omnitrophota bacterium]|jgi:hypothetical protein|nr:LAGLIDADG family homing endonuclease [Candidatus Omnitrophota bacterium]